MIMQNQLVEHIGTPGVFVLSDEHTARFRMARTGAGKDKLIEITSGLKGNEKLLSGPFESIVDGSPVRVVNE